nr:hypothetical protein [Tanacetum cinerariifolium]
MIPEDPYEYVEAAMHEPPPPDFVSKPVDPEFMPPEDEVLPVDEQPLPTAVSPTADSPGYITESNPEEDPKEEDNKDPEEDPADYPTNKIDDKEEEESPGDDADDEEEDEGEDEEEEDHLASADSVLPPVYHTTATMQGTYEIYIRPDDAHDDRLLMSDQLNSLRRDRHSYARTTILMKSETRASRKAWVQSMDASDMVYYEELALMCGRMFPEESNKLEKYVGGLLDMIHGSVIASKPKTMQDAVEFATKLMDKKICTFAERHTKNKRKPKDNSRNN